MKWICQKYMLATLILATHRYFRTQDNDNLTEAPFYLVSVEVQYPNCVLCRCCIIILIIFYCTKKISIFIDPPEQVDQGFI